MSSNDAKHELFGQFAIVAKALSHAHRLELLELLAQGERNVETLAVLADLAVGNASQHLQRLRRAGLVVTRKDGQQVLYRLADKAVVGLLSALRQVAVQRLADVDRLIDGFFRARDSLEAVSKDELMGRMRKDLATVVDVRPAEEFAAGHVPGAVNIPFKELERRLSELPDDQEIVAYCRGPYCVLAYEAVAALRYWGYSARRLEDGLPEWEIAGFPVERGAAEPRAADSGDHVRAG